MRLLYLLVASALVVLASLTFFSSHKNPRCEKLRVVCTTSIICDTVHRVAGNCVEVVGLMGPGIDPHTYRTTPGDMQKLMSAHIIFYNGLHLEGKMSELLSSQHLHTRAFAITNAIPQEKLLCAQQDCVLHDPHIWFDVQLWIPVVEYIAQILCTIDPDETHHINYRLNAQAYQHELRMLNTYIYTKAAQIAHEQKILVSAHDAFHYFGRAYGFHVHALQGISTDSDISTYDIQQLAEFITRHQIRTIFVESSIAHRGLQAVQEAVAAQGFKTHVGPELYSDALGPVDSQAGTYIGMIRYTIDTIVDNLITH